MSKLSMGKGKTKFERQEELQLLIENLTSRYLRNFKRQISKMVDLEYAYVCEVIDTELNLRRP